MKKVLFALLLVFLCLTSVQASVVQNIDAPAAQKLLKENPKLYLLDVRTPQEYSEVRLEGAHLIPIDSLLKRIAEVPKDQPLLVYCAVGSRSSQVAEYLARNGYPLVYNLNGGIWAWKLRNFPVITGGP
ncbi:rhodanese-like domain-containing protein [Geopsychrobacter electrodiphilus]|uniref:rhodanese-like domain-containing protein n=1 Tax=Geopsychrobacter electrodiphilus TaxID=225196 RepID=UPI0003713498|nr:rhodanese-like domain-containing protein [Geopsychrobacter electrodiphilus]